MNALSDDWLAAIMAIPGPCKASPLLLHALERNGTMKLFGTNAGNHPYRESFSGVNNTQCLDMANSGVVWYSVLLVTGDSFEFSFANGYTNYPAVAQLFQGDCQALTCVDSATTQEKANFYVNEGGLYYLALFGTNNTAGKQNL